MGRQQPVPLLTTPGTSMTSSTSFRGNVAVNTPKATRSLSRRSGSTRTCPARGMHTRITPM